MKEEALVFFGVILVTIVGTHALDGSPPKFVEDLFETSRKTFLKLSENPVVVYSPETSPGTTIEQLAAQRKNEQRQEDDGGDEDEDEDAEDEPSDEPSDEALPEDKPTRPDYREKGAWAKGKLPGGKTVDVGFVPQQIYSQVRKYDTVTRLPQEEALKEAENSEEAANAARLREVLTHKKIQQVYEEEGYEDNGYDHAGYNHHGAKYQDHEKDEEEIQEKKGTDSDSDSTKKLEIYSNPRVKYASPTATGQGTWRKLKTETSTKEMKFDAPQNFNSRNKSQTAVGQASEVDGSRQRVNESSKQLPTSVVSKPEDKERHSRESRTPSDDSIDVAQSRSASIDETDDDRYPEGRVVNRPIVTVPLTPPPPPKPFSNKQRGRIVFPANQPRIRLHSKQRTVPGVEDVFMQESVGYNVHRPFYPVAPNVHHYLVAPAFPTFFTDSPQAEPFPTVLALTPSSKLTPPPSESSLFDADPAQFASADMLNAFASIISNEGKVVAPSMTRTVSSDNDEKTVDKIPPVLPNSTKVETTDMPILTSTSRLRRRKPDGQAYNTRNKPYSSFNRTGITRSPVLDSYETTTWSTRYPSMNTRHPLLPRDSSETRNTSQQPENSASTSDSMGPVKHIEQLTLAHFSSTAPAHLKSPPQVQSERLRELARQLNSQRADVSIHSRERRRRSAESKLEYDEEKYPFYDDSGIHQDSALRYASNPSHQPKKTGRGMEFYESRDKLVKCPESPEPPSDPVPERSKDGEWNGKPVPDDLPRIRSVGDTINCLKVKFFGEDPFDNPFFKEEESVSEVEDSGTKAGRTKKTFHPWFQPEPSTKRVMIASTPEVHFVPSTRNNLNQKQGFVRTSNIAHFDKDIDQHFPYKNHKPESASVSPPVQKLHANDPPYPFYDPNQEGNISANDSEAEPSRNKHLFGGGVYATKVKHKNVIKKRRRYRPFQPRPVNVYSIFGTLGGSYSPYYQSRPPPYRPYYYAESAPVHEVVPAAEGGDFSYQDNYSSGSENKNSATYYVVRPGEYTQNKELAQESQYSNIWNYINPLKWWFPNYFDNRRNEPRYRKRRDVIGKIIDLGNLTVPVFPASATLLPANLKPETTTGQPISLAEYKAKLNIGGNNSVSNKQLQAQARLNRLTGALQLRGFPSPTPSRQQPLNSKAHMTTPSTLLQAVPPQNAPSSTESIPPISSTTAAPGGKGKFKILFPRTKAPPRRTSLQQKNTFSAETREIIKPSTTTTTTTTTTQSPSTTTRMYKPKRVVKKPYNLKPGVPLDMFTVLKASRRSSSSFDESTENRRQEREEPSRERSVEHHRVLREEVVKALPSSEEFRSSHEPQIRRSSLDNNPIIDLSTTDNHTITYMVNPVTGVGSWTESPLRRQDKARKRGKRRKQYSSSKNSSSLSSQEFPVRLDDEIVEDFERVAKRPKKRHRDDPQIDKETFIMGLLNRVPPVEFSKRTKYKRPSTLRINSPSEQAKSILKENDAKSSSASDDDVTEEHYHTSSGEPIDENEALDETELSPKVARPPPTFILDPSKRKYYYVNDRR